jgi:hypothetical protein
MGFQLQRLHIRIAQTKMMTDLMHQHMCDDRTQRFIMLCPVIENWATVEPDHIGQLPGLRHRSILRQANAAKQAEQIKGCLGFHFAQGLILGKII